MSTRIMTDSDLKEDLPFRHYTLEHRLIAWISVHLFDTLTYTVRRGLLKGMKRTGGLGWLPALFSPGITSVEEQFWWYPSHRDLRPDHAGKHLGGKGRPSVLPADLTRRKGGANEQTDSDRKCGNTFRQGCPA
jgi:hypothetical protein